MYLGRLGESLAVQYPKPSDVYSRLNDLSFATEGDRAFYTSFDRNKDGMISFAEQNEFLRATGQPLISVPVTTQPATQAAPVIPLALLAYLFLS